MYTPINVQAFAAAQAGAVAGMALTGYIVDPIPASYEEVVAISFEFAVAFDIAWNNSSPIDLLEQQSMSTVCLMEFLQHGPGSLDNTTFITETNWTVAAEACVALIQELDSYDASNGVTVPIPALIKLQGTITLQDGAAPIYFPGMLETDIPTLTCINPSPETQGILSAICVIPGWISAQAGASGFPVGGLSITVTQGSTVARFTFPSSPANVAAENVVSAINTAMAGEGMAASASVQGVNNNQVYIAPTQYSNPITIGGTSSSIFDFLAANGFSIVSNQSGDTSTIAYLVFP